MITVGMDYKIIPGKDDEFTSVFAKVLDIMANAAGHTRTHLYRDVFSEHDYLVVSEWSDDDAFRAFIASDRFRNVTNWGKENVLRTRPTHEIYGMSPKPDAEPSEGESPSAGCPAGAH